MFVENFKDVVLVIGLARSGTSWLGKILESDPHVMYRYEPNNLKKCDLFIPLQQLIEKEGCTKKASAMLVDAFKGTALLKNAHTTGHKTPSKKLFMDLNLYPLTKLFPLILSDRFFKLFYKNRGIKFVSKIVEFDWGIDWISSALGRPKIIFIIRHPCGNVLSYVEGKKYGMGKQGVEGWAKIWRSVHEEQGLPDRVSIPNFKLVTYEALCLDPIEKSKEIFEFLNWDFTEKTKDFLLKSTDRETDGYWGIRKDPVKTAFKWKENLAREEIEKIYSIVGDSKLMTLWDTP
ncbi:MAG: sulfotransferase [Desulfobacterales bacterium]|jgi:hypothetical protein|nr:sulfotransferase [Desulfobacterales bacterium]